MAIRVEDIDLAADRELVERWQAGEHHAFDDLYRRYFSRLTSYCQRRVGDRHTAEEIAQEAFVKALQALPRFAGERRFYPWVTVIASRLCVDHHRRNARVRPAEDLDPGTVDGDHGARLSLLADIDNLDRALQRLGPRHAEVLELRERRGMSYKEIADHLEVPQSTVEALLFRARRALRREFMAVSGERLVAIPVVGGLLGRLAHRLGNAKDRLAEAMPSLSQIGAPLAAGAAAVVFTVGPLAPSPADADVTPVRAGARAVSGWPTGVDPSATDRSLLPPPSSPASSAPSSPSGARPGVPAPTIAPAPPGVDQVGSERARSEASSMPLLVQTAPGGVGLDPGSIATWPAETLDWLLDQEDA